VHQQKHKDRRDHTAMEELQELTMISLNIRGFNKEESTMPSVISFVRMIFTWYASMRPS
jgi:hypothetical protein